MKVITNLLKFVLITLLTICIIILGMISILFSTVLNKSYIMQELENTDFYSGTYKLVVSNFENYIYQSGLDEEVLNNICSQDKVKNDINIMLANIYDGANEKIDTTEISKNLNENIDKLGIKTNKNEKAINEFVSHICNEYTDTLVHSNYENKINNVYKKLTNVLNKVYSILFIVLVVDFVAILAINNKKLSKDFEDCGISILAASIFGFAGCGIIKAKVNIQGIKVFNDVFSNSLVTIIQDILYKINFLTMVIFVLAIIFIGIYVVTVINKKTKKI